MHGLRLQVYEVVGDPQFQRLDLVADTGTEATPYAETVTTYADVVGAVDDLLAAAFPAGHTVDVARVASSLASRVRTGRTSLPTVRRFGAAGRQWELRVWIKPNIDGAYGAGGARAWRAEYWLNQRLADTQGQPYTERLYMTSVPRLDDPPKLWRRPPRQVWADDTYTVPCDSLVQALLIGQRYALHWLADLHGGAVQASEELSDDALLRRIPGLRVMLSRHKSRGKPGTAQTHVEFSAAGARYQLWVKMVNDTCGKWSQLPPIPSGFAHPWE